MADPKPESKNRVFTKKLRDGTELTRQVSTPGGEVDALFDGFLEGAPAKATSSGSSNTSRSTSSSSPASS